MSRVGQISIARPGSPLQLKFEESELQTAIENDARPGDHVTLYPGDFTMWDEDTEIFIEEGISVTILPGAKVDYASNFREEDFGHDGSPLDSTDGQGLLNHPLADGSAERYLRPNFTGHVENIVDLNLGSEWAFEEDVEELQDSLNTFVQNAANFTFDIDVDSRNAPPLTFELGEELEFRDADNVNINIDNLPGNPDGIYVEFEFDESFVTQVSGGDKITMRNGVVSGNVTVDHADIQTLGSPQNSGLTYIQSLVLDDGHVVEVEEEDIATLNQREPRSNEGEEGDIWFVEQGGFVPNLFLSTSDPTVLDGEQGDLWFVNNQVNGAGPAGTVFISEDPPTAGDGEEGAFWLQVDNADSEDSFTIQEVFYRLQSPTSSQGDDNDIWTTEI